jgi:hypothetical protein
MDWNKVLYAKDEKPLERLVDGYSYTSIFRTMAFIGDSLSSGEFETCDPEGKRGYHDLFEYSWGQYIARKNGLLAYNFSRGGMTTREYVESFAEQRGFWDADKAAQAYVIALGVNDLYGKHLEFGSIDDIHPSEPEKNAKTFLGYYGAIISRYKKISPDARFFLLTFPKETSHEGCEITLQMRKALYEIAKIFDKTYVIDLYEYGPVYDEEFKKNFYLLGHLNPQGYMLTAQLVDSYIDYIVRHDPEEFATVGFVGTDIQYKW